MLFYAILTSLLQVATAAPATETSNVTSTQLVKRAEGIHFVNCDAFNGEGSIMPPSSHVIVRLTECLEQLLDIYRLC